MKKGIRVALTALTAISAAALTGCTSLTRSYGLNSPNPNVLPLHRNEYLILGDTSGDACERYLLGAILPWFIAPSKSMNIPGATGFLASIPFIGGLFGGQQAIVSEALYNAIDKVPGADSLMSVRVVTHKKWSIPGIYSEECATVKGKAFEYKTDKS